MDKILITVFLSALAGFLTAVTSIVKLVNEKESKTTDYRQTWTDSARLALSNLISNLSTQAELITSRANAADRLTEHLGDESQTAKEDEAEKRLRDFWQNKLNEDDAALRIMRKEIYQSYALTRLHFKIDDHSFNRVEHKFDVVMGMLRELGKLSDTEKKPERMELKEKILSTVDDIAIYAREILKTEWETVKKGEKSYKLTKRWSIYGSVIMLFILLSIGIHAAVAMWHDSRPQEILASRNDRPVGMSSQSERKDITTDEKSASLQMQIINMDREAFCPPNSPRIVIPKPQAQKIDSKCKQ